MILSKTISLFGKHMFKIVFGFSQAEKAQM